MDPLENNVRSILPAHRKRYCRLRRLVELSFVMESDLGAISPVLVPLERIALRLGLCSRNSQILLSTALHEALTNAVLHGNLELSSEALVEAEAVEGPLGRTLLIRRRRLQSDYASRRVFVNATISPTEGVMAERSKSSAEMCLLCRSACVSTIRYHMRGRETTSRRWIREQTL